MPSRLTAHALFAGASLASIPAAAETVWARGAAMNLRAGPAPAEAVQGSVSPGERLELQASVGDWARVRRADGSEGWLASSYLLREAPTATKLAELEAEAARLRGERDSAARDAAALREELDRGAREAAQQGSEVERVRRESEALRAGTRWWDMITGALLLATGMVAGAFVRRIPGRRRQTRLRL